MCIVARKMARQLNSSSDRLDRATCLLELHEAVKAYRSTWTLMLSAAPALCLRGNDGDCLLTHAWDRISARFFQGARIAPCDTELARLSQLNRVLCQRTCPREAPRPRPKAASPPKD